MYTLIGSPRSPFARICRILMIQNKIPFDFKALDFVNDEKDAAALAKETPINKVPLLVEGSRRIFDSRVIVNYLTQKHGLRPLSIEEENLVSAIYSCMDVGVVLFLMRKDGFDINGPGFFLTRQRERVPNNLNYITPWVRSLDPANPGDWNYASISLYCYIYWAKARDLLHLKDYPEMAAFMDKFGGAPGVRETAF